MYKRNLIFVALLALGACSGETELAIQSETTAVAEAVTAPPKTALNYPETKQGDVTDTYFDTIVKDPYRWLEDDKSKETGDWVKSQNKVTFSYLEKIPYRKILKQRLQASWNYEKYSAPFSEGEYTYYKHNNGLQDQDLVYRTLNSAGENASAEVFLNPNKFSEDGTTSLADLEFSKDGSRAAYAISEGGSDWRKIIVLDAKSKQQTEPAIINVKFSDITWLGNEGFYYSSFDKPEGSELSAKTDQHKVYFHKLGEPQDKDELIYGGDEANKFRYLGVEVSEDERYLLVYGANSTSGNKLFIKDLSKSDAPFVTILDHFESDTSLVTNVGSKLFLQTNLDAPNQKLVTVDASDPRPENWQAVIAETENVLSASVGGGNLFAEYMVDAVSKVYQYDFTGKKLREIGLPGLGTATTISGKAGEATLYYRFTNYYTPSTIYALNVKSGESVIHRASGANFDPTKFESTQVFYASKDGTQVPMIITHKKGLKLDGNNPTILYGYGGFNISLTPYFSVANSVWMDLGGVYAVPNLRGGGEYGKKWHQSGTLQRKQNVFDDFIAAGEYLIEKKYTSSEKLAVRGGSNGGLLVGAVMTQRPKLMKVALPAVGVMDMLRYHTFTAGAGWAYDYGTAEQSKEMFEYLRAYSPVHNVKSGVQYPATLVTTADHDDRVVPSHSFKFAAELQLKQMGNAPTLIRIETSAGHGAGTPVSKRIEQAADMYAFTLFNMGYAQLEEQ